MNDLTPEVEALIVKRIMENKPYLLAIEEIIQRACQRSEPKGFCSVEVRLDVRGNVVEKITTTETTTWIRQRPQSVDPKP